MAREQVAYEEQIRNLQHVRNDLDHLNPDGRSATAMQSQVRQGEAEAARMAHNIASQDRALQKKMKSMPACLMMTIPLS